MMRLNIVVLLLSLAAGIAGVFVLQEAFADYLDATRSYTQVDLRYVDGSFEWLDDEYENSRAEVSIHNRSTHVVTVAQLDMFLYFDGEFAGARYENWQPVEIVPGDERTFETEFQTTANSIQQQGGTADLSIRGRMRLEFEDIEDPLSIQFSGDIGQVSAAGS